MKRFGIISGLALAALALTNCTTKEFNTPEETAIKKSGVPFSIIAMPSEETKTIAGDNMSTLWDAENDKLNVFHKASNASEFNSDGEFTVADASLGTFAGTIEAQYAPTAGNNYDWVAIYPYVDGLSAFTPSNKFYYVGCRSDKAQIQDGKNSTAHLAGYGFAGDNHHAFPLWGKKENVPFSSSDAGTFVSPVITMNQVCSVLAFNIKNSTSAPINITRITFTATEDIVGAYNINFSGETPTFTKPNDYQSATVTLDVTNATLGVNETGTFYAGIKPFTVEGTDAAPKTLSMTVYTEGGEIQTKEFSLKKTMSFLPNKYKNVNMDFTTEHTGGDDVIPEEPSTNEYVLVENLENVSAGYYLIVNYDPVTVEDSYILKNDQLTAKTQTAVTLDEISGLSISNDEKVITTSADNIKWCFISKGTNEFKIKSAASGSNLYLLCKDDNDGLRIATWNYSGWQNIWTVDAKELDPGDADYKTFFLSTTAGDNQRWLEVYQTNPDWRTYTSTATGWNYIRLYKKGAQLPSPGLAFGTSSYEFTLNDEEYLAFTGQTLTNPHGVSVEWESSNATLATVSEDGTVTLAPNKTGETTISAIFSENSTYRSETVSYTIKVNPNASGLSLPFTETFAASTGTMGWSGTVANGTIVYDNEGWTAENASGANGAGKFGASSKLGSATTPVISHTGTATLTFDAGAWKGDQTTLNIRSTSGTIYSDYACTTPITSVTITNEAWSTHTVYLSGISGSFQITFEGKQASSSRFFLDNINIVSGITQPAAEFGATLSDTDNVLAAGGTKTINVTGNVSWTATANNGASVDPTSGSAVGAITVTIPANTTSNTVTYTVTVSTSADVSPNSIPITIMQDAAPSVVNESTAADPYTPAEAAALADELSGGTLDDVYVYGIISKITTAYNSEHGNVSFDISIDGKSTGSQQFRIYRTAANSANDYVVGDAVEFKGTLTKYNSTYELAEGSTLIAQLHKPTISPNGGTFTTSESVTLSVDTSTTGSTGASIRYTTDGSTPTASSTAYTAVFSVTETTTVKAIATKGVLKTGVSEAMFTKETIGGTWTLVTNASTLAAGDVIVFAAYKITYKASGVYYTDNKVMGPISNNLGSPIDVTFSTDGTTIPSLPSSARQYTLGGSAGAWTLMNGTKYLTQGNKIITEETSPHTWTISISGNEATVTSATANGYKLQYNPNSGNGRFATYSSNQKPIRIYRYEQ